ncbi:MAG: DegT/DnrJ/EryC1/StrS family aminotransferase [Actinobacteria bacterium]|nr:DegT/DnrJ/EryC1/StrS family aminotransferase [Actinomycetota bacterium]NCY09033.1 DegT/DnrJ/EryC1/StrS family aminotransferase [Actinomycetota bacterium]
MPGFEVIGAEEQAEIDDVFRRGGVLFRHGFDGIRNGCYKVRDFEAAFAQYMGVPHALAVTSGTAALRVALAALNLQPGDEVITQAFTFVATAEAIIESRLVPVCCEVDDTLNMDPVDLERRITPRTRAVIAVHMLGTPARLREIKAVCDRHNVVLIEDAAWGCGGSLDGVRLGTWGRMGTFSFDFAKTMTTGEGGMIVFHERADYERAAAWHDHGHENNPAVPRWEDTRSGSGFNYRMTELQGAVGLAQLRKLDDVVRRQRTNRDAMWRAIADLPGVTPRAVPAESQETADALVFEVPAADVAREVRTRLLAAGSATKILPEAVTWHFAGTWTHMPELVATHGDLAAAFPTTAARLSRCVSLPVIVKMSEDLPAKIRAAIAPVLGGK